MTPEEAQKKALGVLAEAFGHLSEGFTLLGHACKVVSDYEKFVLNQPAAQSTQQPKADRPADRHAEAFGGAGKPETKPNGNGAKPISDAQKKFILRLAGSKEKADAVSEEFFSKLIDELNSREASKLIDELQQSRVRED